MSSNDNDIPDDLRMPEEPLSQDPEEAAELLTSDTQPVIENETQAERVPQQPDPVYESSDIHPKKITKEKPNKFKRFLRNALIILVLAAILFLAGYLTNYFTAYKPESDALKETQASLEQALVKISELESENNKIPVLEEQLKIAQTNMTFTQLLLNVSAARIGLFMDDLESAQSALDDTQTHLKALLPAIEKVDSDLARNLPIRLELIVTGIARDPEIGKIDLEIFTKDLLELKTLLGVD